MQELLTNQKTKFYIYFIAGCSTFLYALMFAHGDGLVITEWSRDLLYCIFNFNISGFMPYLTEVYHPTNYNFLMLLLVAVWMLPVHLIGLLFGFTDMVEPYLFWYKLGLAIVCILTAFLIARIIEEFGSNPKDKGYGLLFILSPLVWLAVVGMGQADAIENLLYTASLYYCLKKEPEKMMLFASCSIMIKGLSIFLIAPMIVLFLSSERKDIIKYTALFISVPVLDLFIENFLLIGYSYGKSEMATQFDKAKLLHQADQWGFNLTLLCVMLVCGICLFKGLCDEVKDMDYVIYPLISYLGVAFFLGWNPQYVIFLLVPILILLSELGSSFLTLLIQGGMDVGFVVYTLIVYARGIDNTMLVEGPLKYYIERDKKTLPIARDFIGKYIAWTDAYFYGKTIFVGAILLALIYYYLKTKKNMQIAEFVAYWEWIRVAEWVLLAGLILMPYLFFGYALHTYL